MKNITPAGIPPAAKRFPLNSHKERQPFLCEKNAEKSPLERGKKFLGKKKPHSLRTCGFSVYDDLCDKTDFTIDS